MVLKFTTVFGITHEYYTYGPVVNHVIIRYSWVYFFGFESYFKFHCLHLHSVLTRYGNALGQKVPVDEVHFNVLFTLFILTAFIYLFTTLSFQNSLGSRIY